MKIYALSAIGAGIDTIHFLSGVSLSGIIGLIPNNAGDAISGYLDGEPYARQRGIPYIGAHNYGLTSKRDKAAILALDIDILLVVGWQRLVPAWLIEHVKIGVLGIHGSANGISAGRGRSPQNWAIMLRAPSFSVSLFIITPGVDDGPILLTKNFEISSTDEISDTYRKVSMFAGQMISEVLMLDPLLLNRVSQPYEGLYLPQRMPDDGAIDWNRSPDDVCAFVRALSRPYPGAFCDAATGRVRIWKAKPYGANTGGQPGEILAFFVDGSVLVACNSGQVLVTEFDGGLSLGRLPSVDFRLQMSGIVARHQQKYPTLPLSPDILSRA